MLVWLIAIVAIVLGYGYLSKRKLKVPPGPKGLPYFGNTFSISEYPWETYFGWSKEFGRMCYVYFMGLNVYVISDTKLIKEAFNEPKFQGRSPATLLYVLAKGMNGVLQSEGQTWVEQRRFTLRHLRDFGFGKSRMEDLILEEVNDLLETFKKESRDGAAVEMSEKYFTVPVINSLWLIVAGKRFNHNDKEKTELISGLEKNFGRFNLTQFLWFVAPWTVKAFPSLTGWNKVHETADQFHNMLLEAVEDHERTLPEDGNPRDFIDAFLNEINRTEDASSSFYKQEGKTQLLAGIGDLFFAGTETTSSTLAWMTQYLTLFPEVQEKMQKAIDEVTGGSRQVSLADKQRLPYVEATVMETLRMSSIVGQGVVHQTTEDGTLQGFEIPAGSWIVPNQIFVHMNPEIWGDPETFRPERFLSADGATVVKNENLIPFSIGKRACIGETLARDELFLFTANVFQRFSMSLAPGKPRPNLKGKPGFLRMPEEFSVLMKERV